MDLDALALVSGEIDPFHLESEVIRTARRISHVFLMDVPAYPRLLLVTDAAINIAPAAKEKVDIVQNAIDLAHVLQSGNSSTSSMSGSQ